MGRALSLMILRNICAINRIKTMTAMTKKMNPTIERPAADFEQFVQNKPLLFDQFGVASEITQKSADIAVITVVTLMRMDSLISIIFQIFTVKMILSRTRFMVKVAVNDCLWTKLRTQRIIIRQNSLWRKEEKKRSFLKNFSFSFLDRRTQEPVVMIEIAKLLYEWWLIRSTATSDEFSSLSIQLSLVESGKNQFSFMILSIISRFFLRDSLANKNKFVNKYATIFLSNKTNDLFPERSIGLENRDFFYRLSFVFFYSSSPIEFSSISIDSNGSSAWFFSLFDEPFLIKHNFMRDKNRIDPSQFLSQNNLLRTRNSTDKLTEVLLRHRFVINWEFLKIKKIHFD